MISRPSQNLPVLPPHWRNKTLIIQTLLVGLCLPLAGCKIDAREAIGDGSLRQATGLVPTPTSLTILDRYDLRPASVGRNFANWLYRDALRRRREIPPARMKAIQDLRAVESSFQSFLSNERQAVGLPLLTVGLFRDRTRVFESRQGLDHNSSRPLASITKIFTAVAVMQLVERDKLRLEDDIRRWLPDFAPARAPRGGVPITVADLLRHSSGIPYDGDKRHPVIAPVRKIKYRISNQFQQAGKSARYSNQNFYLLGAVIEAASKQSYPDFVTANIIRPLDLIKTRVEPRANAASGMYSTVNELRVFYRQLMHPERSGGKPVSVASLKRMTDLPPYETDPRKTGAYWGLGLRIRYHGGEQLEIYHNGRWTEAGGRLGYFPAEDTYVVYLGKPDDFRDESYRAFHGRIATWASRYARGMTDLLERTAR